MRPVVAGQSTPPPAAPASGEYSPAPHIHPPPAGAALLSQLFTYVNNCVQFWGGGGVWQNKNVDDDRVGILPKKLNQ